jgi:tripeptide aminopeptidase
MERALMIERERMIREFQELAGIRSATHCERKLADILTVRLAALGFRVVEDHAGERFGGNCGNLIADLAGTAAGPTLLLSAHMDTVEPSAGVQPLLEGEVIRSVGDTILGADDKAGIVAILEALRVLTGKRLPHPPLQVIFSVAEEGGLHGIRHLDRSLLHADLGYVFDGEGEPGWITTAAPGQDRLQVVIHGRAAHAGLAPELGVNAILVAAEALAGMTLGRIDGETTANVGMIQGGWATNIVPDRVELALEARSRDWGKLARQTGKMVESFQCAATARGARAEIEVSRIYESFRLGEETQVIHLARRAAQDAGLNPRLVMTGGGSDANFLNHYGVPSAVMGIGLGNPHTTLEFISVSSLAQTAALILSLCQKATESQ